MFFQSGTIKYFGFSPPSHHSIFNYNWPQPSGLLLKPQFPLQTLHVGMKLISSFFVFITLQALVPFSFVSKLLLNESVCQSVNVTHITLQILIGKQHMAVLKIFPSLIVSLMPSVWNTEARGKCSHGVFSECLKGVMYQQQMILKYMHIYVWGWKQISKQVEWIDHLRTEKGVTSYQCSHFTIIAVLKTWTELQMSPCRLWNWHSSSRYSRPNINPPLPFQTTNFKWSGNHEWLHTQKLVPIVFKI
jgi:hypothetical protein